MGVWPENVPHLAASREMKRVDTSTRFCLTALQYPFSIYCHRFEGWLPVIPILVGDVWKIFALYPIERRFVISVAHFFHELAMALGQIAQSGIEKQNMAGPQGILPGLGKAATQRRFLGQ